jgi:hypothetical protein
VRIFIGIMILIICCALAFTVVHFWNNSDINCEDGICPQPEGWNFDPDRKEVK